MGNASNAPLRSRLRLGSFSSTSVSHTLHAVWRETRFSLTPVTIGAEMSTDTDRPKLTVEELAAQFRSEMIPLTSRFSYFSTLPVAASVSHTLHAVWRETRFSLTPVTIGAEMSTDTDRPKLTVDISAPIVTG